MRNQSGRRLPNYMIGLIMVIVLAVASYVAFTKQVPWGGGTEFQVTFNSAQNLRPNSPVRIAGVEVGKVTKVEALNASGDDDAETTSSGSAPTGAVVTMEIDDDGLPWKEDATFTLKPRLFLEGNLFVDVKPGSPSSPAVEEGYQYPPSQTQNTVQLDEILTGSFQADARKDLQIFLDQFGKALVDEGGADSLRTLNKVSPDAYRYTAEVNQAVLGEHPHDLSELIFNLDRVIKGLDRNEPALLDLVTNLRITTGSFAAQHVALEQAIQDLPATLDAGTKAFASLNASFPPLRAFAREALPGVRTTPDTLDATTPLLRQLRGLAQPAELRGLVSDLRPAVPNLAALTRETIPFLKQTRALSSCFNHTILPWADDKVDSTDPTYMASNGPKGKIYEETGYGLAGIAGESRSGDANGQYIRVIGGGGTNTVQVPATSTSPATAGVTPFDILGAMPSLSDSAKTPFKPDKPCENQDPPDLTAVGGAPPVQTKASGAPPAGGQAAALYQDSQDTLSAFGEAAQAKKDDEPDAKKLQRQAMGDLEDFYKNYGN
jgi:phospholipid/cholesterol/gamma-HCH transport system substrate-binding protein